MTLTSLGALAMPDTKAPGRVIETLIVLIIWIINAPKWIQIGRHFQWNFMNENMIVSILISLKFILQSLINDKSAFA